MMKQSLLATVAIICAGAASAQSAWDGPYAGLAFSTFSGESAYDYDPVLKYDLKGTMVGGFAGYNMSFNKFVLGGEVAFSTGDVFEQGFEDRYLYSTMIDVKARLGYDAGQFMPYGLIGISYGNFEVEDDELFISGSEELILRDFEDQESSILTGVGVAFAVSDQIQLSAELVTRQFEFDFAAITLLPDMDGTVTSLSLRAAYSF